MTAPASPRVLLTGFEPFENEKLNSSWEVARALHGEVIADATVHAVQLPCVFGASIDALDTALAEVRPALVICLGYASGRGEITPERVAINIDDARIRDNTGHQPVDTPVVAGGPAAYFSNLPIKAMVRGMREQGVPASVSNTAGTFVCNHIFYALMHRLATRVVAGVRGGFIHVPVFPAHAAGHPGMMSMAQDTQVQGIREAIRVALTVQEDVRENAGRLF